MLVLRLAWRNIGRNPRRTGILVSAVAVGIAGVLLSMSINYGFVFQMVETAISSELGHLQVHAAGFDASPELGLLLERNGAQAAGALDGDARVRAWAPRVRGEGLITSPRASVGVRIVGVDPQREPRISGLPESLSAGSYLGAGRRRIVIGEALARRLDVKLGAKIVLSAQDLLGDLSGEALRVTGIIRSSSSQLEKGSVFISLGESQALFGVGDAVSELVVVASSRRAIAGLQAELARQLPGLEVHRWDELQPVLLYIVDVTEQSAIFVYAAIFVAMAFGIANVLLMTVYERIREIGIMMAIGLSRRLLLASIVAESLLVTLIGLGIGFALTLAALAALSEGIDLSAFSEGLTSYGIGSRIVPVLRARDFAIPTGVALATALLASAWPVVRAARLRPAEAVRQT